MTERDDWNLTGIVIACLGIGLFANGLDTPAGQSIACFLSALALCMTICIVQPERAFWRSVRGPLLLFIAALLWLLVVQAVRLTALTSASDLPLAPDMFLPKYLSIVAGLATLTTGAVLGARAPRHHSIAGWLVFFLTAALLLGLVVRALPSGGLLAAWTVTEHGRFKGLVGNANVMAALCTVGAILSFAGVMTPMQARADGRRSRVETAIIGSFAAALLLNLIGLAMTASRFPAALALLAMAALVLSQWHAAAVRPSRRFWLPFALGVVAIAVSQIYFSDRLFERIGNLQTAAQSRGMYWSHFFDMALSAPLTGYGPGAFPGANLYFLDAPAALTGLDTVNSPHDILLQLWFVGGLPYSLLMLAGAAMILRDVIRGLAPLRSDSRHLGIVLAGGSIVACAMVDIVLDYPVGTQIAFILIGFAWTRGNRARSRYGVTTRKAMKTGA
jgi:O-antigen ligase